MPIRFLHLLIFIVAYQFAGFSIGFLTRDGVQEWYQALEKSSLTPPDFVFPLMWTFLYVLIAAAGWVVWEKRQEEAPKIALVLFGIYTALNWSWSFVFFHFHQAGLGFIWIMLLNVVCITFIFYCWNKFRHAALLMIAPLLWTCFAAYLNYAIWVMNA